MTLKHWNTESVIPWNNFPREKSHDPVWNRNRDLLIRKQVTKRLALITKTNNFTFYEVMYKYLQDNPIRCTKQNSFNVKPLLEFRLRVPRFTCLFIIAYFERIRTTCTSRYIYICIYMYIYVYICIYTYMPIYKEN